MFSRIDTVIVRVRDLSSALQWYADALGLEASYRDEAEQLAVLGVGDAGSLTLWQLRNGEALPPEGSAGTYPIFAVQSAEAAHTDLLDRGVHVDPVAEAPGVRFFSFRDPDGNRLEACQVLTPG